MTALGIKVSVNELTGPTYSNKVLTINQDKNFVFTGYDSSGVSNYTKEVEVGLNNPYVDISEFGLYLSDFIDIPVNEFGLKMVGYTEDKSLVLTANGWFVIYEKELPSLVGLPSSIGVVSGLWVNDKNEVKAPRLVLFSKEKFFDFVNILEKNFIQSCTS